MGKKKKTLEDIEKKVETLDPEIKAYLEFFKVTSSAFTKFNSLSYQEIVDLKYLEFRDLKKGGRYLKVSEAYELLYHDLVKRGKDPEKYGLKGDSESFNRAVNKRKNSKN